MLSFVRPRFFPPRGLLTGEGVGDDDGSDAVARIRRWDIRDSNDSSKGSENSSRKKGCLERFCDGEGEGIDIGVDFFDLGDS